MRSTSDPRPVATIDQVGSDGGVISRFSTRVINDSWRYIYCYADVVCSPAHSRLFELKKMPCGVPENVKRWSLTMFRHGPQGLVNELDEAQFRFGRCSSEVELLTRVATLPMGLIYAIEKAGLTSSSLEEGFEVEICINERVPESDDWLKLGMVAEGTQAFMGSKRARWSYCISETCESMEIVQVSPLTGEKMPAEIYLRVSELPPESLIWAIDNNVLSECDDESTAPSNQETLSRWVSIQPGLKEEEKGGEIGDVMLPGQPSWEYEFKD